MKKPRSNVLRLLAHMLAAVFNSRTAFHREWKRCADQSGRTVGIEGRWVGEWISEQSGHRGALKCVLREASSGTIRAYFYAGYSRWFRVGYVTDLQIARNGAETTLKGEEDLGALAGGIYRCEGEVTGTEFNCRYSCRYDRGVFRLKRPA